MKKITNYLLVLPILFLASCSAPYNARHYMNLEAIPKDVTKNGYTLLIQKTTDATKVQDYINKQIEKYIAEYPYPAVLVTKEELNSPKYADLSKYRYFLQPSGVTRRITETEKFQNHQPITHTMEYAEQFFTDRKENKAYPLTSYRVRAFHIGVKVILGYLKSDS